MGVEGAALGANTCEGTGKIETVATAGREAIGLEFLSPTKGGDFWQVLGHSLEKPRLRLCGLRTSGGAAQKPPEPAWRARDEPGEFRRVVEFAMPGFVQQESSLFPRREGEEGGADDDFLPAPEAARV